MHHWFCTLAALGAMLVLLGGTAYARAAAAGALAGIAACFTQTAGATVLILLGVYLIWGYAGRPEGWRKALCMCLAAIAIFTAVNAPFVWRVGFREWFDNVIVFPVRYFGVPDFNNWRVLRVDFAIHPSFERWIFFPFVYATSALVPAVLAYLILRTIRARRNRTIERDHAVMLIALTGAGMLLAVTPSPSLLRLASASPPGLILLVWLLQDGSRPARIVKASLATIAIALSIVVPLQHQFRRHATLDFPGGRTAFYDLRQYSEYQWLAGHTGPGEYFFGAPSMFVAFRVVNPAPVAVLDTSDYTRPEQVAATLASFRRKRPLLIVTRIPITELVRSASDHTEPFRDYVRTNYKLAKVFATGDAVWEAPLDKTE